ncbi:hypothetical protein ACFW16_24985 [Inquilinus sp. NPDC058860]|uniref:hypothetical protein n=1 Tax=Inquilinus sp. NPDC058860 TaxID=3346652 RepID=UPI003687523F
MAFRNAIDGVRTGPVTKFPDPDPDVVDRAKKWGEILKNLHDSAPEPSKVVGEELEPNPVPHEQIKPLP